MNYKSIISRVVTAGALALVPGMCMGTDAPKIPPVVLTSIKLGAIIMLANLLVVIVLSFFVLRKIHKASWTPSIVGVVLVAKMVGGLIVSVLVKSLASVPHMAVVFASILPSFLIQVAIWYAVLGRKYPKTALMLTGISALFPVVIIMLQLFYWLAGIGY